MVNVGIAGGDGMYMQPSAYFFIGETTFNLYSKLSNLNSIYCQPSASFPPDCPLSTRLTDFI